MAQSDFERYSSEELFFLLQQVSPHKIKELISHLTLAQITLIATALQEKDLPKASEKLLEALQGLPENFQLEALGKGLSAPQFLDILHAISQHHLSADNLSPLLVGLSSPVFFQALTEISPDQLEILKHEGVLEPLQHQLHLFVRECEIRNEEQLTSINSLNQEIKDLQISELNNQGLKTIQNRIRRLHDYYEKMLNAINQALALTWNTNRLDLLERLNRLKEHIHLQLVQLVGFPRSKERSPTGLFFALETSLESVFESLQETDPSIEGLTKFSIWYLKDYWELGLLPSIPHEEQLELKTTKQHETDKLEYRQHLFNLVQDNLNKLGLDTIQDLKKTQIYSKKMLKDYISQHQRHLS